MATSAHTSVTSTNNISAVASQLFRRPNCTGVNKALKTKFNPKGNTTQNEMRFCKNKYATYPYDTAISAYKTVHTGPNNQLGGVANYSYNSAAKPGNTADPVNGSTIGQNPAGWVLKF